MKTKHAENRKKTKVFKQMKDKFLAERLVRSWAEDFVDEDNGEVVSVERNEVIMEKGTLLSHDKLTEIKFFLDSGDITEVEVSDIQRECGRVYKNATVWIISVELNGKGKTIYLYGMTAEQVIEIATDYIEQTQAGTFSLKSIKRGDYTNLLTEKESEEGDEFERVDDKEIKTYKVEVEIELIEEQYTSKTEYVLKATDVEDAKRTITEFVTKTRLNAEESTDFTITIISAKTIPCDYIIPLEFSQEYLNYKEVDLDKVNNEILKEIDDLLDKKG